MNAIKYPNIKVKLVGTDGNAFAILGKVTKALKDNKVENSEIELFRKEATSSDYNHLLKTCLRWVKVS